MKNHKMVTALLYDYLRGELSDVDSKAVESHIADCRTCSQELNSLREATAMLDTHIKRPSDVRSELYWRQFAEKVERRIGEDSETEVSFVEQVLDMFFVHRKPFAVGFASALLVVAVVFGAWNLWLKNPEGRLPASGQVTGETAAAGTVNAQHVALESQAQDYLEQSKVLLISLMNTDTKSINADGPVLQREKEISRRLVNESSALTARLNDPSQRQMKELIAELQLVLVQLANLSTRQQAPGIEIIKGGIEHNGILFRINLEQIQRATKSPARESKNV